MHPQTEPRNPARARASASAVVIGASTPVDPVGIGRGTDRGEVVRLVVRPVVAQRQAGRSVRQRQPVSTEVSGSANPASTSAVS